MVNLDIKNIVTAQYTIVNSKIYDNFDYSNTTMKKFFIRFLKTHGIYEKFIHELKKQRNRVDCFPDKIDGVTINRSLTWAATTDGYDFWYVYNKLFFALSKRVFSRKITLTDMYAYIKDIFDEL